MRKTSLIIILLFFTFTSNSQNIDSLKGLIDTKTGDKGITYYQIGNAYLKNLELDSARIYLLTGEKLTSDLIIKTKIQQSLGLLYFYKNEFQYSLENFKKALQNSIELESDSITAQLYSNVGVIYDYLGGFDKAIENYLLALQIFDKLNDISSKSKIYNNLGIIYQNRGKIDSALNYYEQALLFNESINAPKKKYASTFVNIGSAYEDLEQYDLALQNYKKALNIYKYENIPQYYSTCLSNIAGIYYYIDKLDSANYFLDQAITICKNTDYDLGLSSTYLIRGKIFEKEQDLDSALFYTKKALALANNLNLANNKIEIISAIIGIYDKKQDYKIAFEYQKTLLNIKDSLNISKMNDKIETLKIIYDTDKKEQQITDLKNNIYKNRLLIIAIMLIFSLMLIIFILFYQQKLTNEKYKTNEFNQRLLRAQMNPHFIFNALTSIQYYMLENDNKSAAKYLSSFSKLARSILNNSRNEYITIEEEIETIENYLNIQQLRYENKFDYEIELDENIDSEDLLIPPMLTQPFIENSIKHGFKTMKHKGIIKIIFKKEKNKISISITDNGSGLTDNNTSDHKSHATSITKERLNILNRNKNKSISFKIIDLKTTSEKNGIQAIFKIPVITKNDENV